MIIRQILYRLGDFCFCVSFFSLSLDECNGLVCAHGASLINFYIHHTVNRNGQNVCCMCSNAIDEQLNATKCMYKDDDDDDVDEPIY